MKRLIRFLDDRDSILIDKLADFIRKVIYYENRTQNLDKIDDEGNPIQDE